MIPPEIRPFGDGALLVVLGDRVDEELNDRVHALDERLRRTFASAEGWGRPVPSFASLLVPYDPLRLGYAEALARLEDVVQTDHPQDGLQPSLDGPAADPLEIPVRYGGAEGVDLDAVARAVGRTPDEVVALHSGPAYRVFMLGFSPGFPYLGPLPAALRLPRRAEVRPHVPAGSVAIAGDQTGIYPVEGPGGWHLIGRTELPLWDPERAPPALLRPGQRVRFVRLETVDR